DYNRYTEEVHQTISLLMDKYCSRHMIPSTLATDKALVVPLIQMGPFNIQYDRDFNIKLYSTLTMNSHLFLATSYFNMTEEYENALINNKKQEKYVKLLTASPQANGFYGSKGVSQWVPTGYTECEREFVERAEKAETNTDNKLIQMYEYYRKDWTYHAKGLWLYETSLKNKNDRVDKNNFLPSLICIGSPNFGARSIQRDLEAQLCIITDNRELRLKFHQERVRLFQYGHAVSSQTFKHPSRIAPFWAPYFMKVFRNFF
ncbi:unnamed protein product, partial [Didymodactylos carnosus]